MAGSEVKEVKRGRVKGREGKRLREIGWEEKECGGCYREGTDNER